MASRLSMSSFNSERAASYLAFIFTMCSLACEEIIETLKNMNMNRPGEKLGYTPNYTRTDLTDALHENSEFRTDYEIINDINMKRIIRQTKGKK